MDFIDWWIKKNSYISVLVLTRIKILILFYLWFITKFLKLQMDLLYQYTILKVNQLQILVFNKNTIPNSICLNRNDLLFVELWERVKSHAYFNFWLH